MSWIRAMKIKVLARGASQSVTLADEEVRLCRLDNGEVFGVADSCSHDNASFEGGTIEDACLTCPRHGAVFDVVSGKALKMPAVAPIETYPVRITDDGWIEVQVEEV